jgi:hypothetical protein
MPLHMLGCMEEQPQHSRGQLLPSDRPDIGKRAFIRGTQLLQRSIHPLMKLTHKFFGAATGARRISLRGKCHALGLTQRFVPRIGEESIDHTADVLQVKAHGGDAGGTIPEPLPGEIPEQRLDILAGLQQRVRHRLNERRQTGYGSAKPHLGLRL